MRLRGVDHGGLSDDAQAIASNIRRVLNDWIEDSAQSSIPGTTELENEFCVYVFTAVLKEVDRAVQERRDYLKIKRIRSRRAA